MGQHTHLSASGGIRRGPRRADHFTILSNAVLNDERLSFRARGVLIWLLSKPADWRTRSESIAEQSPREGREAIRTAMRELSDLGYLVREKVQDERGRWSTIQTVYEEPSLAGDSTPDPEPRKSDSGGASTGEPGALTKDGSPRTETNNNTRREGISRLVAAPLVSLLPESAMQELAKCESGYADLQAACIDAGLAATFDHVKPEQKAAILALIDLHGVPTLVATAKAMHRDGNPTLYAQGWIRAWNAMPLPRASAPSRPKCSDCEGSGFVLNDDDLAVRCSCRTAAAA